MLPKAIENSNKDHVTNEGVCSKIQALLENKMDSLPWSRNENYGGLAVAEGPLV